MSVDELAPMGGLAQLGRSASALRMCPDFIEKLPVAIYACDRQGRILWFNARAVALWGRTPRIGDDTERFCGSYKLQFRGRQITREETPMAAVLKTGIPIRGVEALVEGPDGLRIWATVHIEPVEDEEGRVVGAINCFHETTELHRVTEALEDLFENAVVGLHLVAGDGTILRANAAELQMLGYPPDEYIGRNIAEFHVDQMTIADILERLLRNEKLVQYPARLRAKDGSIRHVLISSSARFCDGELVNTRCFTIDITGRLRTEELVRQQEQRLAATYQHAGIGIVEVDAQGKLLRVNAQLCALMGYSPDEVLGRSIFHETNDEDIEADHEQFQRQVAGELDRYTIEKRIRRKDGSYLWASITSSSIRDADGQFLYAVRIQHDLTERRRAEEALAARIREQTALFQFTDRLQRAESLDDVYEPALDAILDALQCSRASILLRDSSGMMRFVASRGLSEPYRRAVDGHSPWGANIKDADPICVDDVGHAAFPETLKRVVIDEGIYALAFIPLQLPGRLIGKFMACYDVPHPFTRAEVDLAVTIARQLGFSIERMRVEQAAHRLAAVVESSDDAIVSKDLNGILATFNQGAERLFGYKAEEVIGKPVTILIPPDRQHEEPEILDSIRRGERIHHYETLRRRRDGTLVDVSLTVSPVKDDHGTIIGASKIARDITERKLSDARLRDSERQLQELIAAVPAAIYTTDAQGKITYFNQAAVELAGRTPTLGSDEWCVTWKLYHPDGTPLPHDECPMAIALKEGRAIRNAEAVAERPDGTRVPFIPYPTPLRDGAGKIVGAVNMLVDVSERKQAETQQQALLSELNHRVKNNMQMLQSLLDKAARRARSSEAREVLEEASGRIAAMAASQRLLYATPDATQCNARDFLTTVCETTRQAFPQEVDIECEADVVQLSNDAAMPLALVANELLTNAVKHGLNGRRAGTIRVRLTKENDSFLFYVEDDGPGFDLQSVQRRSSGLALVQGLARQLRGEFEVTRTPATRCSLRFQQG